MEMGKSAFVTGADGFIGSHLIKNLLKKGYKVKALVHPDEKSDNLSGMDTEIINGDLADPDELEKVLPDVDYVFHLAAILGEGKRGFEYLKKVNIDGSKTLIDHYMKKQKKLKRFVFTSSVAAAGPSGNSTLHNEMSRSNPESVYGRSKLETENYLLNLNQNFPFTIIRLPLVYGPMSRRGTLMLFKLINKGVQIINFRNKFSIGFVEDICDGIIRASENDIAEGERYYLGEEAIYTTHEIMSEIAGALKKRTYKLFVPYSLLYIFCFIIEKSSDILGKSPSLRRDSIRSYFKSNWCVNIEKAEKELSYKTRFPLKKG